VRCALALLAGLTLAGLTGCGSSAHKVGQAACAWHLRKPGTPTDDDLTGLAFPDLRHGWAVGGIDRPVIRVTSDGGATWRAQHAQGDNGLSAVAFADDANGWAVGVHNTLFVTTDGGSSWTRQDPRLTRDGNLYDVSFVDRDHGWVVGSGGVIRRTDDGGRTWTAQQPGTHEDLSNVQFTGRLHGWIAAGDGEILHTADGGATWAPVYSASSKNNEVVAGDWFLNARQGWVSGSQDDGESNHGVVSRTIDGGRTWKHQDVTSFDDVRFGAIAFVDSRHGWVAGYQGELWYSDDGGVSWGSRPTPALGERIYRMVFRDARHGWAVGESGTIEVCTA
jgi:photosystem II stability/assembly factor-like uncharacterized protein